MLCEVLYHHAGFRQRCSIHMRRRRPTGEVTYLKSCCIRIFGGSSVTVVYMIICNRCLTRSGGKLVVVKIINYPNTQQLSQCSVYNKTLEVCYWEFLGCIFNDSDFMDLGNLLSRNGPDYLRQVNAIRNLITIHSLLLPSTTNLVVETIANYSLVILGLEVGILGFSRAHYL